MNLIQRIVEYKYWMLMIVICLVILAFTLGYVEGHGDGFASVDCLNQSAKLFNFSLTI